MGANAAVIAACVVFFQVDPSPAGDARIAKPSAHAQVASAAEPLVQGALAAELPGTYLVGPAPILVHDKSPRLPTRVGVPDLAKSP